MFWTLLGGVWHLRLEGAKGGKQNCISEEFVPVPDCAGEEGVAKFGSLRGSWSVGGGGCADSGAASTTRRKRLVCVSSWRQHGLGREFQWSRCQLCVLCSVCEVRWLLGFVEVRWLLGFVVCMLLFSGSVRRVWVFVNTTEHVFLLIRTSCMGVREHDRTRVSPDQDVVYGCSWTRPNTCLFLRIRTSCMGVREPDRTRSVLALPWIWLFQLGGHILHTRGQFLLTSEHNSEVRAVRSTTDFKLTFHQNEREPVNVLWCKILW